MRLEDFRIGMQFWMSDCQWLCTDVGSRTIAAIKLSDIDTVLFNVGGDSTEKTIRLTREEAEREKWFSGPPYAVVEHVLDAGADLPACSYDKEGNGSHSDLGFGKWVRVGEGPSKHVEWRPAPRRALWKRSQAHLDLLRRLDEETDEDKHDALMVEWSDMIKKERASMTLREKLAPAWTLFDGERRQHPGAAVYRLETYPVLRNEVARVLMEHTGSSVFYARTQIEEFLVSKNPDSLDELEAWVRETVAKRQEG